MLIKRIIFYTVQKKILTDFSVEMDSIDLLSLIAVCGAVCKRGKLFFQFNIEPFYAVSIDSEINTIFQFEMYVVWQTIVFFRKFCFTI